MPQFDLNILNTQNINIFSFFFSYLFYLKNIYLFLLYYFKISNKVLILFVLYFLKDILYIKNTFSYFFSKTLSFLKELKITVFFFYIENKASFF